MTKQLTTDQQKQLEYERACKNAMKPDEIEGKDYSIIYDYDGNWVKYYHASQLIFKISYRRG